MRVLIELALILFLPYILYGIYGWFARRRGKREFIWDKAPLKTLGIIGLVMVAFLVSREISDRRAGPYVKWHPSEYRDGKFVPGYFEGQTPKKPAIKSH